MSGEPKVEPEVTEKAWARPPYFWVQVLAAALTIIAFLLNILDSYSTREFFVAGSDRRDATVLLAVLASPLAALLAIAWPLVLRIAGRALTLRRTLIWLLIALVSIVGWPVSCFTLFAKTFKLEGDVIPR
jgi:hypothetical protein